jgi:hypothetical protein
MNASEDKSYTGADQALPLPPAKAGYVVYVLGIRWKETIGISTGNACNLPLPVFLHIKKQQSLYIVEYMVAFGWQVSVTMTGLPARATKLQRVAWKRKRSTRASTLATVSSGSRAATSR